MSYNANIAINFSPTTQVNFRALGSFITDPWQAGGFIRTGDTGQINWTTVSFLATNNTVSGYEIRYFNDGLEGTVPLRCKLEYGQADVAGAFAIWLTAGMGSDGAGNITNIIFTRTRFASISAGGTSNPCVSTGGTDYAGFFLGQNMNAAANPALPFSVERTRDANGNATADGILVTGRQDTSSNLFGYYFCYVPYNTRLLYVPEYSVSTHVGGCLPPKLQTTGIANDNNTGIYPCYFFDLGSTSYPGTVFVGAFNGNFINMIPRTIKVFGTNHTYIGLDTSTSTNGVGSWLDRGAARLQFGCMIRAD